MSNIAFNTTAFNDLVGDVAVEITLKKRKEIFNAKNDVSTFSFFSFLKTAKIFLDQKYLGNIDNSSQQLTPVIKMAAKDATMIVTACVFGIISSDGDDATYT